jgi:hypothetical protein
MKSDMAMMRGMGNVRSGDENRSKKTNSDIESKDIGRKKEGPSCLLGDKDPGATLATGRLLFQAEFFESDGRCYLTFTPQFATG